MRFHPILDKKCNLWKLRKHFFDHKGSDKGQAKGGIQMAKRGENIHKRKDGRWEGRYIKGRTTDGKPIWGYLYGYAYGKVKDELMKRKVLSGFYQLSGKSMRFSALAELWLSSFAQSIKESTYAHYQYTLHKYLLPVLGSLPVSSMPESQATWRILGTGMSWDAAANLQIRCTSTPHAAHRDMRQTATHTETRTTTLDPDRTGFSQGISFIRTNHP